MSRELQQAIEVLRIRDVRLVSSNIWTSPAFDPLFPRVSEYDLMFRSRWTDLARQEIVPADAEVVESSNILKVFYEAAFRLLPQGAVAKAGDDTKESEAAKLVEVVARFAAIYDVNGDLSEECAKAFAEHNVGYHVWPYWREYAASTSQRLGLPRFVVPMYQVPKGHQRSDSEQDQ